jgi:hypothetical protein
MQSKNKPAPGASDWKVLSPYCIEHKETGHRVNKIGEQFEVWYRVEGKYKHAGMHDNETAKRKASEK